MVMMYGEKMTRDRVIKYFGSIFIEVVFVKLTANPNWFRT